MGKLVEIAKISEELEENQAAMIENLKEIVEDQKKMIAVLKSKIAILEKVIDPTKNDLSTEEEG